MKSHLVIAYLGRFVYNTSIKILALWEAYLIISALQIRPFSHCKLHIINWVKWRFIDLMLLLIFLFLKVWCFSYHIIFIFWKYLKSSILSDDLAYRHSERANTARYQENLVDKIYFLDVQATVEGARANIIFIIGNQNMLSSYL